VENAVEKEKHPKKAVVEKTFPVAEEELTLGKRRVETGITRVTTKVTDNEQVVEQPLMKENVEVQHVTINRFIDSPVQTRTEGDTIIVPVMEEVLVVEKKLRLKEEIHITRHTEVITQTHKETLRKQEVIVEHIETNSDRK
jgi:uncharacterized protein (TIGR02271 family)